ncbi:acetylcholine receptor subunit alpha-like [Mytilus californianus]|uniref:acetylcholine receptor subunit alpha-like n=1 Tax=Mytilus californianus TaxID=6549 RepID=UPI00224813A4|nr:acetylcholine receptor subunit alpha-like [Mytilus californianus]
MKMQNGGCVVILIYLVSLFKESYSISYRNFDTFFKNITGGKNINLRPVLDHKSKVNINMSFHLIYIQEFNEVEGKLSLTGYFNISWVDQTLSWNSTENGIEQFTFQEHIIWKPSFIIGNPYDGVNLIYKDENVMRVQSNGVVTWTPGDNYEVFCNADVSRYPFDTQICKLEILPWGYTNEEIVVVPIYDYVVQLWFNPQKTWEFIDSSVTKREDIQLLEFAMKLKRYPMFFVLNLILPICVMIILNIFVFLLPPESGERVGYAVTVLLAITVFLTISSDNLPATSSPRISSISLLLFADVCISAFIVIMVIVSSRYYHREDKYPVTKFMRGFVNVSRIVRCKMCCCRRKKEKYSEKGNKEEIKWTEVGKEIDIVCGICITAAICIINALYIIDVAV